MTAVSLDGLAFVDNARRLAHDYENGVHNGWILLEWMVLRDLVRTCLITLNVVMNITLELIRPVL